MEPIWKEDDVVMVPRTHLKDLFNSISNFTLNEVMTAIDNSPFENREEITAYLEDKLNLEVKTTEEET